MNVDLQKEVEASKSGYDQRDASYYFDVFNLGPNGEALKGKRVLDIGAGRSNFADIVNRLYGESTVTQIDPRYTRQPPDKPTRAITGVGQEMPFANNYFDEVYLNWSGPYWTKNPEEILKEALRVTKPDGKVKIRPAMYRKDKYIEDPIHPSDLTTATPFQEKTGEYYYTVEITKAENPQRTEQEIKVLTRLLDFSPGNKEIQQI